MSNTTIVYNNNEVTIERINLNSTHDKLLLTMKIDNMLLHSKHNDMIYTHAYYVNNGIVLLNNIDNQIKYQFSIYDYDLVAKGTIDLNNYVNKNILSRSIVNKVTPKQLNKIKSNKYNIVFKIVVTIPESINNDNISTLYNL